MRYDEDFLRFSEAWERTESRRFATADGSSAYTRALRTHTEMMRDCDEEGYLLTPKVALKPDFFPLLTDSVEDGLMYEMGFSLMVNGTDAGRVESYRLERPNRVVVRTPDMELAVRVSGLHIERRR